MSDLNNISSPLVAQDEWQEPIPELTVAGAVVPAYNLNWRSLTANEVVDRGTAAPETVVTATADSFSARIQAETPPLSMQATVFPGGIAELDPASSPTPAHVYDCLNEGLLRQTGEGFELELDSSAWGGSAVVAIFAEYWRNPTVAPEEGPTNLISWVFEYRQA